MIELLKLQLKKEEEAKAEAMKPYNIRIKNLKTAISNLETYNDVADRVNQSEKPKFELISVD